MSRTASAISAAFDTESMSRTASAISAAFDTESMRAAANQAWATLDGCIRAEIWSTTTMDVTSTGLPAPSLRVLQDRVNEASRDANEGAGLPALQSCSGSEHSALWVTLTASAALLEEAPGVVRALLGELLVALGLLGRVQDLHPVVPGLLMLIALVSIVLTLVQHTDRQ